MSTNKAHKFDASFNEAIRNNFKLEGDTLLRRYHGKWQKLRGDRTSTQAPQH